MVLDTERDSISGLCSPTLAQSIVMNEPIKGAYSSVTSSISGFSLSLKDKDCPRSLNDVQSVCGSEENRNRSALTRSLIMEDSCLSMDITRAIRKSSRLHLVIFSLDNNNLFYHL